MRCPVCQSHLSTKIAEKGPDERWTFEYYCDHCQKRTLLKRGRICPRCHLSFHGFQESGQLGCGECYLAFAPELDPLLTRYQGSTPGKKIKWSLQRSDPAALRMAEARTGELLEAILHAKKEPPSEESIFEKGGNLSEKPSNDPDAPILQSVRVRMARNIRGLRFWNLLHPLERQILRDHLLGKDSAINLIANKKWQGLENSDGVNARLKKQEREAVLLSEWERRFQSPDGRVQIRYYIGDEDHFRAEWLIDGGKNTALSEILGRIEEDIRILDQLYLWEERVEYGHLTACPGNSGSGIRVSFQIDLTGLYVSAEWQDWLQAFKESGIEVRGPEGEGSLPGPILQLSNRYRISKESLQETFQRLSVPVIRAIQAEANLR